MNLTTKLTALLLFILFFSACSKDDEPAPTPECTTLTTSATINGDDSYTLQVAQLSTSSGFDGTNYIFQIGAVDSDCEESVVLSLIMEVSGDIGGTYPVVDFFDANLNEAHGTVSTLNLGTSSQTMSEIQSGSVMITDNGDDNFSIDFEGTLVNGDDASFATTHTF